MFLVRIQVSVSTSIVSTQPEKLSTEVGDSQSTIKDLLLQVTPPPFSEYVFKKSKNDFIFLYSFT